MTDRTDTNEYVDVIGIKERSGYGIYRKPQTGKHQSWDVPVKLLIKYAEIRGKLHDLEIEIRSYASPTHECYPITIKEQETHRLNKDGSISVFVRGKLVRKIYPQKGNQ